ncbi:MAG: response regulator, partial [Angelakisella sp.]
MNNKILIAEDESNIRKLVAYYLTQEGFSVSEACCGTEALTYFEKNPDLALVILDVMMPEPNGCEVCRAIRRCSNVPILMLTARDTEQDEMEGFHCGADEYISKPFSP